MTTQLTSVYDMALIASAAYKNDTLLTISKDKELPLTGDEEQSGRCDHPAGTQTSYHD